MKTFVAFSFVSLAVLAACQSKHPNPSEEEKPGVTVADTHAIGDGVEIYRALLDWKMGAGNARTFETGTVLEGPPLFRYDDIKRYYKFFRDSNTQHLAFEMNKKIFTAYSQEPSVLGKAFLNPQSASDTGFAVTLNKVPVYFAYYRSRTFGGVTEKNLAFSRIRDFNRLNDTLDTVLPVLWDSIYSPAQKAPRSEPDPRLNKRLLERLKKDHKLGF